MQHLRDVKIITIIERTLNLVDSRLIDHGKRVAYRMFKELYPLNIYSNEQLRDICMLGLLHDIGAYKTEDVYSILSFDTERSLSHSIYGYLFLKHFSPLKELAPIVLYHHANQGQISCLSEEQKKLAQLLKHSDLQDIQQCILKDSECLDFDSIDNDIQFNQVLMHTKLDSKDIEAYIKMIVFSIDFRSPQTMLHTFAAAHVAETIARLAGVSESQIDRLKTAAMLHDIGKMGTPLYILEGTSTKLPPPDMEIMKKHVVLSEDVLQGCVSEDMINIAVNHHEKLNGKGYPKGLNESSLPYLDRLMAVADTFSAMCVSRSYQKSLPKERILEILNKLGNNSLLDGSIIKVAIDNYDKIASSLDIKAKSLIETYDAIIAESQSVHKMLANGEYSL